MQFKNFPSNVAIQIVRCIESAVGDDIRADIMKNSLRTTNSIPFRIWDFLNKNLLETLDAQGCCAATTYRGPWQMVVIYEESTGSVITLMREKRFTELKRAQKHRSHMHYVDMLPKMFNAELLSDCDQQSFMPKEFADENNLAVLVQQLLRDLVSDVSVVQNHVLVLFDTTGFQLTQVRAVMVTPSLDIAEGCDADWSKYISSTESLVVEQVENPEIPANNPQRGLKLKAKATKRQQSLARIRQSDDTAHTGNK